MRPAQLITRLITRLIAPWANPLPMSGPIAVRARTYSRGREKCCGDTGCSCGFRGLCIAP
jgi:hypothetical protein